MSKKKIRSLLNCLKFRICELNYLAGEGHVPSSLSILDMLMVIYDNFVDLNLITKESLKKENVILSKGHGCLAQYVILEHKKIIKKKDLNTIGKFKSSFGGHPDRTKIKGIDASTGSLGHGFPYAAGIAYVKKINNISSKVYCIIGDGECNEGTIWETCLLVNKFNLTNLVCLVDNNKSSSRIINLGNIKNKFLSFGWETYSVNGHNYLQLKKILSKKNKKPMAIICNTIKGNGIKFMQQNPNEWHHKKITASDLENINKRL